MMAMNNTYYHFIKDIESDDDLGAKESGLRMESVTNPAINQTEFDMYCLAVSILHGCNYCCNVHSRKLRAKGVTDGMIGDIARIVSVLKAARDTLDIERMRSYDFIVREESIGV